MLKISHASKKRKIEELYNHGFFELWAASLNYGVARRISFYIDATGVLCGADKNGAPADENDPPIQEQFKFTYLRIDQDIKPVSPVGFVAAQNFVLNRG
jgi:hypothetical protein